MKKQESKQKGFTLIELLVVVAILSMMASIIMVGFKNARIKSRDAKRLADIQQLNKAMQLFRDKYGMYPHCSLPGYPGGCDLLNFGAPGSSADTSLDGNFMGFLQEFIKKSPKDPLNTINPPYFYGYGTGEYPIGSGQYYWYFLATRLEDTTNPALKSSVNLGPAFAEWYIIAEPK